MAAGLVCFLAGHKTARGQGVGYQLNRYEPTPAGDAFSIVEAPWYSAAPAFAAALAFDYAYNLLAAEHVDATGNVVSDPAPIAHHQAAYLAVAGSIRDRVGLSLNVPVVLGQSGTPFAGVAPSGTTAGDPRAGARVRLFGDPTSSLSLSAAAYLWIPIGVEDKLAGDTSARGMARLILGGRHSERLQWSASASFLGRKRASLATTLPPEGNTVGSEVQLAGGRRPRPRPAWCGRPTPAARGTGTPAPADRAAAPADGPRDG